METGADVALVGSVGKSHPPALPIRQGFILHSLVLPGVLCSPADQNSPGPRQAVPTRRLTVSLWLFFRV